MNNEPLICNSKYIKRAFGFLKQRKYEKKNFDDFVCIVCAFAY